MKLELKHLAGYLPYGLNLKFVSNYELDRLSLKDIVVLKQIDEGCVCVNAYKTNNKSYIPILRPLSDLTKEIEHNGEKFVPLVEIIKHLNFKFLRYEIKDNSLDVVFDNKLQTKERFWFSNFKGTSFYCSNMNKLMYKDIYGAMNKLFEWHFDIHGLIGDGLAIDINTLNQCETE